jgi:hypothetical protein
MASLAQLKKKKEMLLKKAGMKKANLETIRQRDAEKSFITTYNKFTIRYLFFFLFLWHKILNHI